MPGARRCGKPTGYAPALIRDSRFPEFSISERIRPSQGERARGEGGALKRPLSARKLKTGSMETRWRWREGNLVRSRRSLGLHRRERRLGSALKGKEKGRAAGPSKGSKGHMIGREPQSGLEGWTRIEIKKERGKARIGRIGEEGGEELKNALLSM